MEECVGEEHSRKRISLCKDPEERIWSTGEPKTVGAWCKRRVGGRDRCEGRPFSHGSVG